MKKILILTLLILLSLNHQNQSYAEEQEFIPPDFVGDNVYSFTIESPESSLGNTEIQTVYVEITDIPETEQMKISVYMTDNETTEDIFDYIDSVYFNILNENNDKVTQFALFYTIDKPHKGVTVHRIYDYPIHNLDIGNIYNLEYEGSHYKLLNEIGTWNARWITTNLIVGNFFVNSEPPVFTYNHYFTEKSYYDTLTDEQIKYFIRNVR